MGYKKGSIAKPAKYPKTGALNKGVAKVQIVKVTIDIFDKVNNLGEKTLNFLYNLKILFLIEYKNIIIKGKIFMTFVIPESPPISDSSR
jgi:hypothetical protein